MTLLAVSGRAEAQRQLSLEDALKLARANNRDLKASRESIALAQVTVEQVRAQLLPSVAAQGRYTYNTPSAQFNLSQLTQATDGLAAAIQMSTTDAALRQAITGYRQMLAGAGSDPITIVKEHQLDFNATLSVPLVVPGAYPAYQAAAAGKRAASANVDVTETTVLFGAATLFYGAAGTEELVAARKHAIEVAQETVKNAKARLEAGVVNRVEVTRAELAYNRAVQQHAEAIDARSRAYRQLRTMLLLDGDFTVAPGGGPTQTRPLDELQRNALTLRPEARAYELNVEATQKSALSGWLRWVPSLSGFARFAAGNYASFSGKQYSFAAGVQADWLIYDGGVRDAARHQAEAQRRQVELQQAQFRDTLNSDIAQAEQELRTKREALRTAEKAVLLSKETLGLVRAQHDAGTATQLDLLQAQDALSGAEAGVAQARFDLSLGELSLERVAGIFPPRGEAR